MLGTTIALAGGLVAVLAGIRFAVEGRRLDLLLTAGFFVAAASTLAFGIAPAWAAAPVARSRLGGDLGGLARERA